MRLRSQPALAEEVQRQVHRGETSCGLGSGSWAPSPAESCGVPLRMLSVRALLPRRVGGESGTEQLVRAHHEPVAWVGGDPTPCLGISGCSCEQNVTGSLSWVTGVELFKIWLLNS